MTRIIRHALICSAPAWLLLSQGCSRTNDHIPDVSPIEKQELYQPFVGGTGLPEQMLDRLPYRLMPSDVLEIIYQVRNIVTDKPYDLKIEDVIRIKFPYQDRFDQKLTVQGDGNIRCLMLGQVRAAGRTAGDLEEQLRLPTHVTSSTRR